MIKATSFIAYIICIIVSMFPIIFLLAYNIKQKHIPQKINKYIYILIWIVAQFILSLLLYLTINFDYGYLFKKHMLLLVEILMLVVSVIWIYAFFNQKKLNVTRRLSYINVTLCTMLLISHFIYSRNWLIICIIVLYLLWHIYCLISVHLVKKKALLS